MSTLFKYVINLLVFVVIFFLQLILLQRNLTLEFCYFDTFQGISATPSFAIALMRVRAFISYDYRIFWKTYGVLQGGFSGTFQEKMN